mmetsp:Transcript_21772/g.88682  ORF Transcript_21772/g.88682 Transcript_21772/m.88682 type:complete len:80 (-) Transcript_21772:2567-2806(-)
MDEREEFYLRYYVGHNGEYGHEFLEFEFRPDGKMRYANNSNYKKGRMIRKEGEGCGDENFIASRVLRERKETKDSLIFC